MATPLQLAYATSILANKGVISIPKQNKKSAPKKSKDILNKEEFFKKNSFESLITNDLVDKNKILQEINYDRIFDKFIESIEESTLGSMLKMVGGKKALYPLKEPLILKIKEIFYSYCF